MANNQYVNKVEFGNQTVMDISDTTATASDVLSGKKLYTASGAPATGTLVPGTITEVQANGTSVATSGIANIPAASTSGYGVTKLNNTTSSTSTSEAATAAVVKQLNDKIGNVAGTDLQSQVNSLSGNITDLSNTVRDKVSFNLTLQTDTSSTSDVSTIALAAWNKAPSNGTAFIMQDCKGPAQQCLVFRRASSGVVLVLDATGMFYTVSIVSSAVSLVRKVSLTTT